MNRRRYIGTVAAAALAALWLAAAGPAAAAQITLVETGSAAFPKRAYALHTSQEFALNQTAVTLTENGDGIEDFKLASAADAARNAFATVLVIDASNSMRGAPIAQAMRAARAFAARRAEKQQFAVVTFGKTVRVQVPPTTDATAIDETLSHTPKLDHSTHLYDGVDQALRLLADTQAQAGALVVLSDGADTGSNTKLAEVVAHARAAGVRVFTVGLRSQGFDPDALRQLATGGISTNAARPGDLALIFKRLGARLASDYLLTYDSPATAGEAVTVNVKLAGIGEAQARYHVPRSGPMTESPTRDSLWSSSGMMIAVVACAAGLLGMALFLAARPRSITARERLAHFLARDVYSDGPDAWSEEKASRVPGTLERLEDSFAEHDWWTRFIEELDVARIEISPMRILLITFAGTVLTAFLIGHGMGIPILIPLALLVPFGVRLYLNRRLRGQREEFGEQLADSLQLVASSLRAGQSMAGAFTIVPEQAPEPTRSEFRRIANDERLGVPLEQGIRVVARRMDSRDMEQLALVATIQKETGGNSAEVIDQLIATIRERMALRRLMRTLTAQGRLTQIVVSALPVALLLAITIIQPDYMEPLFETNGGHLALLIAAAMSITGSLIIRRIVALRG